MDYTWILTWSDLSGRYGYPWAYAWWYLHLLCPSAEYMRSIWREGYKLVPNYKQFFSGSISCMTYTVSWWLLEAKVNQVKPCFNMIWKSKGFLLTIHLILNLSLNFILTDFGKLILLPFKVILTSFQSNSITPQIKFHFNFTFSGVNVPVILNKCDASCHSTQYNWYIILIVWEE